MTPEQLLKTFADSRVENADQRPPEFEDWAKRLHPRTPEALVTTIAYHQNLTQQGGTIRLAEDYLADCQPFGMEADFVVEVIYQEWVLRQRAGEVCKEQEYFQRFPEHQQRLERQLAVDEFLYPPSLLENAEHSDDGAVRPQVSDLPVIEPNRYEILRQLGRGAMGSVYLARDKALDREIAIKVPKSTGTDDPEFIERFQREARAAADLRHPNICQVFDVNVKDDIPYITMTYVDGVPLSDPDVTQRITSVDDVIRMTRVIADAVAHAHANGVVHRDLKPGNILVDTELQPHITDFGLAKMIHQADDSRLTQDGRILGTPAYMPPEQVQGNQDEVGPHSDVYALGVILFELLTGRLPFVGTIAEIQAQTLRDPAPAPMSVRTDIPRKLDALCLRMLEKDLPQRVRTMAEVSAELQRIVEHSEQPTDQPGWGTVCLKNMRITKSNRRKSAPLLNLSQRGRISPRSRRLVAGGIATSVVLIALQPWFGNSRVHSVHEPATIQQGISAGITSTHSSSPNARDNDVYLAAIDLTWQDRFDEAEAKLAPLLKDESPHGYLGMGWLRIHQQEYEKAIAYLVRARELKPAGRATWNAFTGLARCYQHTNQTDLLELVVRDMLQIPPEFAEDFRDRADLLERIGDLESARREAAKAIQLNPASANRFHSRLLPTKSIDVEVTGERLPNSSYYIAETPMLVLRGHSGVIRGLAFGSNNSQLWSASEDGTLRLWNLDSKTETFRLSTTGKKMTDVLYLPDRNEAVSSEDGGRIYRWDCETGRQVMKYETREFDVIKLCLAPGGKQFASCGHGRYMTLWNVLGSAPDARMLPARTDRTRYQCVGFSSDEKYILGTQGRGGQLLRWNRKAKTFERGIPTGVEWYKELSVVPDTETCLVTDTHLTLWNYLTGENLGRSKQQVDANGKPHWIDDVQVLPNGQDALFRLGNARIGLLRIPSMETEDLLDLPETPMSEFALSSEGDLIATEYEDHSIGIWRMYIE